MAIATLAERGELSRAARSFLRTEAGSAVLLLGAAVLALLWTNLLGGYEEFWHTDLTLTLGGSEFGLDLRHWVNDGLMVLFFLSVGLEIARETTLGELRGVRALVAPALGALGGLVVPAGIYLLFNAGGGRRCGVGCADLHRHRGAARCARPGRPPLPGPAAGVPARAGHRRRHRRGAGDRAVLHRRGRRGRAAARRGAVRRAAGAALRALLADSGVRADRRRDVARRVALGGAPERRRGGDGAAGQRLRAAALRHRPCAGDRAQLPRRSDAGPRRRSAGRGDRGGLAERAAAAADPAVEQLRRSCRCSCWPTPAWR